MRLKTHPLSPTKCHQHAQHWMRHSNNSCLDTAVWMLKQSLAFAVQNVSTRYFRIQQNPTPWQIKNMHSTLRRWLKHGKSSWYMYTARSLTAKQERLFVGGVGKPRRLLGISATSTCFGYKQMRMGRSLMRSRSLWIALRLWHILEDLRHIYGTTRSFKIGGLLYLKLGWVGSTGNVGRGMYQMHKAF